MSDLFREKLIQQLLTQKGVAPQVLQLLSNEADKESQTLEDIQDSDNFEELEELELLKEIIGTLGETLGACRRCCGLAKSCPVCDGEGEPGTRQPNEELFRDIVLPAWQRLKRERDAKRSLRKRRNFSSAQELTHE